MKEIMIAYWSGTGNTAAMAAILGKGIPVSYTHLTLPTKA